MMDKCNFTLTESLAMLSKARHYIKPNHGFMEQLKTFEKSLHSKRHPFPHDHSCDLCRLKEITPWYYYSRYFAIMECEMCNCLMAVWKLHGKYFVVSNEKFNEKVQHQIEFMQKMLEFAANIMYGPNNWNLDKIQRTIPNHLHWHARPNFAASRKTQKLDPKQIASKAKEYLNSRREHYAYFLTVPTLWMESYQINNQSHIYESFFYTVVNHYFTDRNIFISDIPKKYTVVCKYEKMALPEFVDVGLRLDKIESDHSTYYQVAIFVLGEMCAVIEGTFSQHFEVQQKIPQPILQELRKLEKTQY